MAMKRTSLHLDDRDLKALERLAKIETQHTGSRVSASAIVRRLVREFLRSKACKSLLVLALLPAVASAESYLCIEDHATGFRFNTAQNIWQQSNFNSNRKYLVKPNADQSLKGKWIVLEIGDHAPLAWSERDFTSVGALRCEGSLGEFAMNRKNLRFVRTYIFGYWTDAIPGEQNGTSLEGKDTPLIGIGKCSPIEP